MKQKILFIVALILMIQLSVIAQTIVKNQADIGGSSYDYFQKYSQSPDGSIYAAGYSFSNHSVYKSQNGRGGYDYWVYKFELNKTTGDIHKLWEKTVGGYDDDKLVTCVATNDGGCILGGSSRSGKSREKTDTGKGGYDWWIVKLNKSGYVQWDKAIGTAYNDNFCALDKTNDGGYILLGNLDISTNNNSVIKTDSLGNIEWRIDTLTKSKPVSYESIQQTVDGGYILGGEYTGTQFYKAGNPVLTKTDASGNILWTKEYTLNPYPLIYNPLFKAQQTKDNSFILYGVSSNGEVFCEYFDCYLDSYDYYFNNIKTDTAGNVKWTNSQYLGYYGGGNYSSLAQTGNGDYFFLLPKIYGSRDYYYEKIDNSGKIVWQDSILNNVNPGTDVLALSNGNYLLGGITNIGIGYGKTKPNLGDYDFWLVLLKDTTNQSKKIASISSIEEIKSATQNATEIYPNPVKDILHIQTKIKANFSLINAEGKLVASKMINGNGEINVSHLPAGLYYLKNNSTGETEKVIVSH